MSESSRNLARIWALIRTCRWGLRACTHVRIKGQNFNFYLETHATSHKIHAIPQNIYVIRLRILRRILVHYAGVWMTLNGLYTCPYKRPKSELYLETHATVQNIYFIRLRILRRILVHYTAVWMTLKGTNGI